VRNKTVPLTFVNSAFLQSLDPDLGFLNLPFTITDQLMAKPGVAEGILALVRSYVEPRGLKVFSHHARGGHHRHFQKPPGANARRHEGPSDPRGGAGRVPGHREEPGRCARRFPAIEMGAALARGAMDGIITSPGGWGKNVQDAPSASLVPGLLFYTYFLIADKAWFDALPAAEQKALAESGRASVTEKWARCRRMTRA
jgi:C4-dicarboxylate-binding protein DctP